MSNDLDSLLKFQEPSVRCSILPEFRFSTIRFAATKTDVKRRD